MIRNLWRGIQWFYRVGITFTFLFVVLWVILSRPIIKVEEFEPGNDTWAPIWSWTICTIRTSREPAMLNAVFISAITTFGYFSNNFNLTRLNPATMGSPKLYNWLLLMPWLFTFMVNWSQGVGKLFFYLIDPDLMLVDNAHVTLVLLALYYMVQALLVSEVICMAMRGCFIMAAI